MEAEDCHSNTAELSVSAAADLQVTKTDGKLSVDQNELLTYQIVVTNNGPSDVTGAQVLDTIPSSLTGSTWICTRR